MLSANPICPGTRVASRPFEGGAHGDGNIIMRANRICEEDQHRQNEPDMQILQLGRYLELSSHISSLEGALLVSEHDFGSTQCNRLYIGLI